MVLANPFNFVTLRNAIESRGASEHQYGSISSDDYTNTHIHTHTHTHTLSLILLHAHTVLADALHCVLFPPPPPNR